MKKTIKVNLVSKKSNWTTLGEVCEKSQYGWTTSASKTGSIKLLRTTDITKGKINWETVPFCKDKPKDIDKYLLKNNDIVISRAGSIGESYILKNVDKSVFASYLIRFTPKKEVNPDYVAYFLKNPLYWMQVREASLGIAIPNINATKLNGFKLPLPERQIQDEIVEEIETQFTRLDSGVAALKRAQANLKRYRAAMLKAACEGKLVPTEAELARSEGRSYETGEQLLQRILAERKKKWEAEQKKTGGKKKYVEPKGPDVSDLPKLPKGWAWATVQQVALETMLGLDRGRSKQRKEKSFGIPYIKMNNVTMDGTVLIDKIVYVKATKIEINRYRLLNGDILFNTRNSKELVGKVGFVNNPPLTAIYNNNLMRIRVGKLINPKFIALQMCADGFRHRMELVKKATTSVAAVYAKDLFPLAIALPPIDEQNLIAEEIERIISVIDKQEESIAEKLKMAGNLRNAILKNAFITN